VFHISIWGLGALLEGVSPPKPPLRGDGTGSATNWSVMNVVFYKLVWSWIRQVAKLHQINCCKTSHQKHRISFFWNFAWKSFCKFFLKKFLVDPKFSSSLNASPRSAVNSTTQTNRCCRQKRFSILFALIDLTG